MKRRVRAVTEYRERKRDLGLCIEGGCQEANADGNFRCASHAQRARDITAASRARRRREAIETDADCAILF